ncbi:hypothetical protein EVAR_24941_1 [Eumeta japonica]|uniref:Uncharacterized protein n=1 Tax=Eumeta variegata TaxID=151549 RepID=A0A4C1ZZQ9_EUMVA|nr:hypothetical protein EVAR_24941_1 [Eumeta japonica]
MSDFQGVMMETEGSDSGAGSLEAPSSDPESQSWSKYISGQFQQAQICRNVSRIRDPRSFVCSESKIAGFRVFPACGKFHEAAAGPRGSRGRRSMARRRGFALRAVVDSRRAVLGPSTYKC